MASKDHSENVGAIYSQRASEYDKSHHVQLAKDFVDWAKLVPGSSLLDLAAGTGLVTIFAKKAVGEVGRVVGVEISAGMLDEAKRKSREEQLSIDWLLGDIGEMDENSQLRRDISALSPKHGFETITCCSALILLQDPARAVKQWAEMLATGGQMIVDTPHNITTLAPRILHQLSNEGLLSSWLLHGLRHGMPGEDQLREWLEDAGLRAETWVTPAYVQKEISLQQPETFWNEVRQSVSWNVKIQAGVAEEKVKARFIEILRSMNPGEDTVMEQGQIIVARGWKT